MIAPGLCSITFRSLDADAVVDLAVRAGVDGIEWGADGHVPPGGGETAVAIAARCRDTGLEVVSYGSYLGAGPADGDETGVVAAVLDSAEALGAPMVRIWTEFGVTAASPADERRRVLEHTARLVDAIAARGLLAALEFHPGTLTETAASANRVLDDLDRPALRTHWQPDPALGAADAVAELALVAARLAHVHVFTWGAGGIADRRPLAQGTDLWPAAFALADHDGAPLPGRRFALCEYVRDDDPEQFVRDVRTLRRWLDEHEPGAVE
jgi:sugar phosphate isomerase/epimerase